MAKPMKPKVVITVEGGVVSCVQFNAQAQRQKVEVYLRDWDVVEERGLQKPELVRLFHEDEDE